MTRLRLDQLPAKVRDRIEVEHGSPRPKRSRAGVGMGERCPGRCGCGERFDRYTRWERHAQATGHGRWSIDLAEQGPDSTSGVIP